MPQETSEVSTTAMEVDGNEMTFEDVPVKIENTIKHMDSQNSTTMTNSQNQFTLSPAKSNQLQNNQLTSVKSPSPDIPQVINKSNFINELCSFLFNYSS